MSERTGSETNDFKMTEQAFAILGGGKIGSQHGPSQVEGIGAGPLTRGELHLHEILAAFVRRGHDPVRPGR